MASRFFPYAHQSIDASDIEEVSKALSSDFISRGPFVEKFENEIATYCGAKYAVAFNNGTSALIAASYAAQVNANDRLITTPNTFVASVTSAMHFNATPVFVDIDRNTGNIDLNLLEHNLKELRSSRGRQIIMPVHFAGIPVDMQRLDSMIMDPDTVVIEDAAHAIGSHYPTGEKVGSCAYSHMTIFSFHPAKTITTGEGGMVTTNDPELYHRLLCYRNNCIVRNPQFFQSEESSWYEGFYEAVDIGGNYNFTDFQAALGISQLQKLDRFVEKRRKLTKVYRHLLKDMPNMLLFTDAFDESVAFHLFVAQIDFAAYNTTRASLMQQLKEKGIGTQLHYIPVYKHPFFVNKCGDISSYFPRMEEYYSQALTLPLYYNLEEGDVEYICNTLKDILVQERSRKVYQRKKQYQRR